MKKMVCLLLGVMAVALSSSLPAAEPQVDQTARFSICGEPDILDPRKSNNVNAAFILGIVYEGLVDIDISGKSRLALAQTIDVSDDRSVYTIHLKPSKWSDGHNVTAHDFEYSWKTILEPSLPAPCGYFLYCIKNAEAAKKGLLPTSQVGIKAIDDMTLVVEMERPTGFFIDLLPSAVFLPIPKHLAEKNPDWGSQGPLVTNGPFQVSSWKHENELLLLPNPHFREGNRVHLKQIKVAIIPDEATALRMFEQGELDWIGGDVSPLPLDAIPQLKKEGNLQKTLFGGTRYCALNTHTFPFNNLNMRKAFSLAVNRRVLIDNVTHSDDEVATNMISSIFKRNHKISLFPDGDAALARQYFQQGLKELNITPEELNITLKYENCELSSRMAQVMQQQWFDVLGVRVNLEKAELKVFVDALKKRNFQMGLIYWMLHYNDPMDVLDRYRSKDLLKNYPSWENVEYTQLLDEYFEELNADKRLALVEKLEATFIADMPVIPLFHFSRPYMMSPKLKGVQVSTISDFYFTDAYIAK